MVQISNCSIMFYATCDGNNMLSSISSQPSQLFCCHQVHFAIKGFDSEYVFTNRGCGKVYKSASL